MRIISLAAIFMKNRDVLPHVAGNLHIATHRPAVTELTPEQRAFVSGGPQVKNEPQL